MSWTGNDVIITFEGEVDFHEITEVGDHLYGDTGFDQQVYQILDFRDVNAFNL